MAAVIFWGDYPTAQQNLQLQKNTLALAVETTAAIKRRVNTPDAELARAQANQARREIELNAAQEEYAAAKVNLSTLWAELDANFAGVSADLFNLGLAPTLPELLKSLDNNPDLQLFASEARLQDAQVRLAQSQRKADVDWSAGIRRLLGSQDTALVLGVSLPLFNERRTAGDLASAQANRLLVDKERDAKLWQLRAQVAALYQSRQAAIFEFTHLRDAVILPLKRAVSSTQAGFEKGRYGYQELSAAQQELLAAQAALIAAASKTHVLRAEIERLAGTALTTPYAEHISKVAP